MIRGSTFSHHMATRHGNPQLQDVFEVRSLSGFMSRTCQVITVNAKWSQEPEQLPAGMGEHHFSLRRSPSPTSCCQLQDPCPEGLMVGWALEAPLSHLAKFCGVCPGCAEFPLQWPVLERTPGRARGCMGRGEYGSFSLQDKLFPKASKNTSSPHRQKT